MLPQLFLPMSKVCRPLNIRLQGAAIVRDCWSRVVGAEGTLALDPKARRNMVQLSEDDSADRILGVIYTCQGYLCNSSLHSQLVPLSFLLMCLLL
ncbi:hypothetical protein Y032_0028g1771 [Ancylostoma ceylanicum]|uniref:Uncharacterized protein n=2 Tax=Ancylostoma ceylanicum TaxID=53326 RepID=A0A016USU3_9BILA|nr:hypothetical protein Y032_0028g1771 [Ancylostoma ceylanicum]